MKELPEAPPAFSPSTSDRQARRGAAADWIGRQRRLTLKELRETLRDRRTIITLVLMPVLVYPLLGVAFQRFLVASVQTKDGGAARFRVGVESENDARLLQSHLSAGEFLLAAKTRRETSTGQFAALGARAAADRRAPDSSDDSRGRLAPPDWRNQQPRVEWFVFEDLNESVRQAQSDLGIRRVPVRGASAASQRASSAPVGDGAQPAVQAFELVSLDESEMSKAALEYVESRLKAANESDLSRKLANLGNDPHGSAETLRTVLLNTAPSRSALATLAPLILILMTITGAVYPAIDLTAGERERNTLETLIAAPVSRLALLLAKYVAVMTVAMLTASVNLAAMTITATASGLGGVLFGDEGLTAAAAAQVFGLMILFAAFFAAVLLAVTSFARSFKEAQAYLIPLMMLSLAPGMLSLTPDLKLSGPLAVAPLVNIVLLARDALQGEATPVVAAVVVASTVLYALAAIGVAARVFGADSVLYGGRGSWSDLWRPPAQARSAASIAGAMSCLAVVFALFYVFSGLAAQLAQRSLDVWLAASAAVLAGVFGGAPLAALLLGRVQVGTGLALRSPHWIAWPAALVLGASLWPLAYEIFVTQEWVGAWFSGAAASGDELEWAKSLLTRIEQVSPAAVLICMAAFPGVFEELFFRGYLFTAFSRQRGPAATIAITSLIFAAFHVITDRLNDERFLPSLFVGVVLGYLRHRSGSVAPGMLAHVCHNGLLLTVVLYRDKLDLEKWFPSEQTHLPWEWLAASAAAVLAGLGLAKVSARPQERARDG